MLKSITQKCILMMLALFIIMVNHVDSHAQKDSTDLWNIVTNDGNEYTGVIVQQTEKELKLRTTNIGTITLQLANIKQMNQVKLENLNKGQVWLDNSQEGRYFFSPSSYGLRKGEGYYQNAWIFFNQISYGLSDNFSIGAGMVPLFLFNGTATPFWVTPKVSIPITENEFAVGGGALLGTVIGNGGSYGIVYGTSTFGSRDKNMTIGVGYGYVDDEFADTPAINLSAMIRTGKRGYFITENYFVSSGGDTAGLLSFGGRRLWSNVALDYGGIIPVGSGADLAVIPWLGIVFSFGR